MIREENITYLNLYKKLIMKDFAKSILNYFVTYTETRFRFNTKIDYKWTNDSLTHNISVFPSFEKTILNTIKEGKSIDFVIKRNEFIISLNELIFKNKLKEILEHKYDIQKIDHYLEIEKKNYLKKFSESQSENDSTEKSNNENIIIDNKIKELWLNVLRKYNLDFRKEIKNVLIELQQKKLDELKEEYRIEKIPNTSLNINSIELLINLFSPILKNVKIDIENILTYNTLFLHNELNQKVLEYIKTLLKISKTYITDLPDQNIIHEYYETLHRKLEYKNDKHLLNWNNYSGDMERIKHSMKLGKRLTIHEYEILLKNISCIISTPVSISKYFPMEDDVIDILVIDEAYQLSIADSISLILCAKQVVVFGDELQYGTVSTTNVSSRYSKDYFKDIINNYSKDDNIHIPETNQNEIIDTISQPINDDDEFVEPVFKPEEGKNEWLKTFSIRTSTLSFAKAIHNYSTSLNTHFRSFPEIIEYSNEIFYKPNQVPLTVNRIRTKPIKEVLRFIKVDTQGNSGENCNLDEILAIKDDIEQIIKNGFKGTIGIISSFREQNAKMMEILSKELVNYHILTKDNKLKCWFVADVQGEERDIIYYSFVEDKQIGNGDLKRIYPVIGGVADDIRSIKKQRLNVGFSRARDTMVFVHSIPIKEYSSTCLGEALKMYYNIQNTNVDNFISDEVIFDSPAEKKLYSLLINSDFYKQNREKLKIIPQFPIGKYIRNTFHKYIPKYRVDFLMTLSDAGKEKSLIIEYDGIEFHTKNPEIVTKHNFLQQFLEYDKARQIELESYGYKFLRINKFTLKPNNFDETEVDVLNKLLINKFR